MSEDKAVYTSGDLHARVAELEAERLWLARRLSLHESPRRVDGTLRCGGFKLNDKGEIAVCEWIELVEREIRAGELLERGDVS